MTNQPCILCVDDQPEVLAAVRKDLGKFSKHFQVIECDGSAEARDTLNELDELGTPVALVISDHVMPGESGVDLLAAIAGDERFKLTRKMLLTGLATHEDTIRAINAARIDHYITKPWELDELLQTVSRLLAEFVADSGLDPASFLGCLDSETLFRRLHQGP